MTSLNHIEILLVEDDMSDAELTIRALEKKNMANNLIHVNDGVEALDFIFAQGQYSSRDILATPKVIFLDMKMPKMDGMEVLAKIRAHEQTKHIPVVMFTSSREESDVEACYRLGANSYIVKPVEFDNFLEAVTGLGSYWLSINHFPQKT